MKRIKLIVAYDGTNYCGWQFQINGITIEEVLNKALTELLKEPITVIGASRTDSGVHALGNVAVFDTVNRMPADRICFALNQRLPEDIRILKSEEVSSDWHPRKQNCTKTYEYRILNRKIEIPTLRLYSYFCYMNLDVGQMKKAAEYLRGEHDFKSFCTVRTQIEDTVRTIYDLEVEQEQDTIVIRISGSGFLYNMVRIIAGTLIKVGMGAYPPEYVEEILDARNRQVAGPKAPAKGLTLVGLDYEQGLKPEICGENKYWKYQLIQTEVKAKGKSYLIIERCEQAAHESLLTRVVHQAIRNGALKVYVCDKEQPGRIITEKSYGYYKFEYAYDFEDMSKLVVENNNRKSRIAFKMAAKEECAEFCGLYNEIFFSIPNSATITEREFVERWQEKKESFFFLLQEDKVVGFAMLKNHDGKELEIDSIGIKKEYRQQGLAEEAFFEINQLAAKQGIPELTLLVSTENKPAYLLYQKLGFEKKRTRSKWFVALDAGK